MTNGSDLGYRLFAKLLMFLTFLFGGLTGYFVGVDIGQQKALELVEKGRLSVATTAEVTSASSTALQTCYEKNLGQARYATWKNGQGLTVDEVFQVLPCESLKK